MKEKIMMKDEYSPKTAVSAKSSAISITPSHICLITKHLGWNKRGELTTFVMICWTLAISIAISPPCRETICFIGFVSLVPKECR